MLVTRREGKPFAIIYRPRVAGFKGEPTILKSPTGEESFDAMDIEEEIALEYRKRQGGFTVLAEAQPSQEDGSVKMKAKRWVSGGLTAAVVLRMLRMMGFPCVTS